MRTPPILTICVPSRNRQETFKKTIESLVVSLRTDIEFIFADNSDDPSIMNGFMTEISRDPRVTYLPSTDRVLPMNANWERCIDAAAGDFICVIGDDDYVDPEVADLIIRTQATQGQIDVITWARLNYNWPDNRRVACNVAIPLGARVAKVEREHLSSEFFGWVTHSKTPNCPFSIYHGAVSRQQMNSNKARFGGAHFGHLTVDFETTCKLLHNAHHFFYCERPYSVLGACLASNSGSVGDPQEAKRRIAQVYEEIGRNIETEPYMKGFPFSPTTGVVASVCLVQQWFCHEFKISRPKGWERYFAEACGVDCDRAISKEKFDLMKALYTRSLREWKGGRYLKYFKPTFKERSLSGAVFTGVDKDRLFIDENIAGVVTPGELYHIICSTVAGLENLEFKVDLKRAA